MVPSEPGRAAAGIQQRWSVPVALGFLGIELLVRFGKQFFDALPVAAVDGHADTGGKARWFIVIGHDLAYALNDAAGFFFL